MTRTIIITGATSGIGMALTQHLAQAKHNIIAVGRNQLILDKLSQKHPEHIKTVVADITKVADRLKIKEAVLHANKAVFLIHNAGIAIPTLLEQITEEEWDQHNLVNTKAPLFLTKLLLPQLKNGGRVLNISTGLAHGTLPGFSAYGVSKAALYMVKEFCNTEFLEHDIAFGSAMPGIVDTPIQEHIRSTSVKKFPAVGLFEGFKQRNELLTPKAAAKFLSWLLLETEKEQFIQGDWDIYNTSHHKYWAEDGDIKLRQS